MRVAALAIAAAGLATLPAYVGDASGPVTSESVNSGDWTTSALVTPTTAARGTSVQITASVTSAITTRALVDLEVVDSTGMRLQKVWDRRPFTAGQTRTFSVNWVVPADETLELHTVRIGIFAPRWKHLSHWNGTAATFDVTTTSPTPTVAPTTTSVPPSTTTTTAATTIPASTTDPSTAPSTTAAAPSSSTTTSVAAPSPSSTSAAPAPTTAPSPSGSGAAFFEDFSGNTGLEQFRTGVFHRERDAFDPSHPEWVLTTPWLADHADPALGGSCGDPTQPANHHERHAGPSAADDAQSFFMCNEHMMTTMGDVSGYSVAWFSPNQTFSSVSKVCWDVNISTEMNGHRQWWEVAVEPASSPEVSAIDWLAGTANLPSYGEVGAVVLGFGPDNPPHPKISVGNAVVAEGGTNDPAARSSVAIRRPHCLRDNGDGTLTYSTVNGDGSPYSFSAPGSFPSGPLEVVFKDHNYTPNKDCATFNDGLGGPGTCRSYTWHWDNIEVTL